MKTKRYKGNWAWYSVFSFCLFLMVLGCKTKTDNAIGTDDWQIPPSKAIAETFQFGTTKQVTLNLSAITDKGEVLAAPSVLVFWSRPYSNSRDTVLSGGISSQGNWSPVFSVPNFVTCVFVLPNYPGLMDTLVVPLVANGNTVFTGSLVPKMIPATNNFNSNLPSSNTNGFVYPGNIWDNYGAPSTLNPMDQELNASFLSGIYNSLPEGNSVVGRNFNLIPANADVLIQPGASANVSVTFVQANCQTRNTLAYYVYDRANPPSSLSDLNGKLKTIIFPNFIGAGNGGNLVAGSTVSIGNVPPNYGIGFLFLPNAFKDGKTIDTTQLGVYTNSIFNNETSPDNRPHAVQLKDADQTRLVIGFEEGNRDDPSTDNDFNDLLFYVSSDQPGGLDFSTAGTFATLPDGDGDGINDIADQYPSNINLAYNNYFPSAGKFGTICFEDLWPATGDYDFNDLVVNSNFNLPTNSLNQVVQINTRFKVKAIGGTYKNGFGFQLNIAPGLVKNIKDSYPGVRFLNSDKLNLSSFNGTEGGQSKATFIVFDSPEIFVVRTGGVNYATQMAYTRGKSNEIGFKLELNGPTNMASLGMAPFNPFIYSNKPSSVFTRGTEVHLIDQSPTDLVNQGLFGTLQDRSNIYSERYYRAYNNMPFAIYLPIDWQYPIEKANITTAYPLFLDWASSNGAQKQNWYQDLPGNTNKAYIYTR